ncbi:hypothetical protein IHE55_24160 [Streptomyces pactum]|uniref:DNA-binding protein n=1 Tax=Streptomyces pactum TaxID=68249 RepID=A0ABS0NR94_9ACTN|nr:hypothetical protein [Streptomyces pactum]MBH5337698.1 hypothetical protein [Streptomyces pactum]
MTTWEDAAREAGVATAQLRAALTAAGVALPYLATTRSIAQATPTARVELGGATVADVRRLTELITKGLAAEGKAPHPVPGPGAVVTDTLRMRVGKVVGWDGAKGALTLRPADGGDPWEATLFRSPTEREKLEYRMRENAHRCRRPAGGRQPDADDPPGDPAPAAAGAAGTRTCGAPPRGADRLRGRRVGFEPRPRRRPDDR